MTNNNLFHCLAFRDADAGIAFLKALGFEERLVVRNESDPRVVEHAQFQWRENGGVMFGSANRPDDTGNAWERRVGVASCYLVVETDGEVDAAFERALGVGATSTREPVDEDYGGRGCVVVDPEGNQWSIGSYSGK